MGHSLVEENQLNVYFLPLGANWVEMPQKLANSRSDHVAFLVPDGITNCTLVENSEDLKQVSNY